MNKGTMGCLCAAIPVLVGILAASITAAAETPKTSDVRETYARQIAANAGLSRKVKFVTDRSISNLEGFVVESNGKSYVVKGGGPAGLLYGAQELVRMAKAHKAKGKLNLSQKPDFTLRGNALFLMKDGSYDYQLTPKEFPWFYGRPLLTKYLDYLFENRFNTIFLWSGNLFPSLVELPEYPDSTDLPREQLLQNQEQFRWFTSECAKRNISVLVHFYQIHIPLALAKTRGIPAHYTEPNDFVRSYMRYVLTRFLTIFDSVGLYVCPGEVLKPEYQPEWIRDVIFAAAKDSGRNPVIVVRDWTLDAAQFVKVCVGQYGNLYTELKHNIEALVSPVPDERHRLWTTGAYSGPMFVQGLGQLEGERDQRPGSDHRKAAKKHIANLHELTDLKPFRWGSPAFVREMVSEWKKIGLDGAEVYGMVSWRWPYTLDKLSPKQSGLWPDGPKLLTFERDAIWLEAIGRYMWQMNRGLSGETAHWEAELSDKFGSREAGRLILKWYDTTGPIMPALENNWQNLHGNMAPTVLGGEAMVDRIQGLTAAKRRYYPVKPVDLCFFNSYKKKYGLPKLTNRIVMPVDVCADRVADGSKVKDQMTPDKALDLLLDLAEEGVRTAEAAQKVATRNQDEATRFVTDSRALALVVQAYRQKVLAAINKRLWQKTERQEYADKCLACLRESVRTYELLVALTDETYVNATDMNMRYNWHAGLEAFKTDLSGQERLFQEYRDATLLLGTPDTFEVYGDVGKTVSVSFKVLDSPTAARAKLVFNATDLDGGEPGGEGVVRVSGKEYKLGPTGEGETKPVEIDLDPADIHAGAVTADFVLVAKPGGTMGFSISDCKLVVKSNRQSSWPIQSTP